MKIARFSPLTVLLVAAIAGAGWVVGSRILTSPQEPALMHPVSVIPKTQIAGVLAARPNEALTILGEAPLFHASRKWYVAPPVVANAAPPAPTLRLVGTLIVPSKPPMAVLAPQAGGAGANRRVHPGDEVDGWRVSKIEANRVVLQFEGQHIDIARQASSLARLARSAIQRQKLSETPVGIAKLAGASNGARVNQQGQLPDVAPRGRAAVLAYMQKARSTPAKTD